MQNNDKPSQTNLVFLQIILAFAGSVIAAYLGYLGVRATVETPIHATQTAESRNSIPASNTPIQSAPLLEWNVEVIQSGQTVPVNKDNTVEIPRNHFTFRVSLPISLGVAVNVFDKSTIYQLVVPGYKFTECPIAFCDGTGIALAKGSGLSVTDAGYLYLYYTNPNDNNWSEAAFGKDTIYFDKDVVMLNNQPVEWTIYKKLYFVFYINYHDDGIVSEDEVKNIIVQFK